MPPTATPSASTAAQRSGPAFSRALAGTRYGIDSRWIGPPPCSKFIEDGVTSSQGASSPRWLGRAVVERVVLAGRGLGVGVVAQRGGDQTGSGSGPARGSRICRSPVRTWSRPAVGPRAPSRAARRPGPARPVGRLGAGIADRRRLVAHVARGDVGEARAAERRPAGQHLVQHDAERVEVGARVDLAPQRLLGRHVLAGAEHAAGLGQAGLLQRAGDPEVGHADPAVVADQDVAGLQVAVDAAAGVGGGEAVRDLDRDREGIGDRDHALLPEPLPQIGAVDQLEHEVRPAVHLAPVEQLDGVRVRDPLEHARLAIEARERLGRVGGVEVQELDRDLAAGLPGRVRATPRTSHRIRGAPRANSAHRRPRQSPGAI